MDQELRDLNEIHLDQLKKRLAQTKDIKEQSKYKARIMLWEEYKRQNFSSLGTRNLFWLVDESIKNK
jgi:hypothetical protein